jgi:outer membrane protein assembly factor BamB
VLWVLKSQDHFIASPVPHGDHLYVSGLGAFNVSTFSCLSTDPKSSKRVLWSKTTPQLKLPTVSSPAVQGQRLVFGDGMHQTDGASLHCLRADSGLPLWEFPAPGSLVHLEGSPTIAGGRVYVGGGAAGALCVDLDRVTLEGKEMDVAAIQKILTARWQDLLAKYEAEKKKDPDFAVPPSEDQLPRPTPRLVWQQGKDKWHVDAPLALAGDQVLVGSAFLDKEKLGDRALICLDAKTGEQKWRTPLALNPWGGPSVDGAVIVVGGSSIGYEPRALKGARGLVTALSLADGKERWHKEVTGGVLSSVALAGSACLATATDGKVRAFDLATGERRWIYDAKAPCFAPVAVAGGVVFAGDLKGVIHAVDLTSGQGRWKLDLASHPDIQAPGMIYGGPVVQGGRLYVATCNLEGSSPRGQTAIVCLGDH